MDLSQMSTIIFSHRQSALLLSEGFNSTIWNPQRAMSILKKWETIKKCIFYKMKRRNTTAMSVHGWSIWWSICIYFFTSLHAMKTCNRQSFQKRSRTTFQLVFNFSVHAHRFSVCGKNNHAVMKDVKPQPNSLTLDIWLDNSWYQLML